MHRFDDRFPFAINILSGVGTIPPCLLVTWSTGLRSSPPRVLHVPLKAVIGAFTHFANATSSLANGPLVVRCPRATRLDPPRLSLVTTHLGVRPSNGSQTSYADFSLTSCTAAQAPLVPTTPPLPLCLILGTQPEARLKSVLLDPLRLSDLSPIVEALPLDYDSVAHVYSTSHSILSRNAVLYVKPCWWLYSLDHAWPTGGIRSDEHRTYTALLSVLQPSSSTGPNSARSLLELRSTQGLLGREHQAHLSPPPPLCTDLMYTALNPRDDGSFSLTTIADLLLCLGVQLTIYQFVGLRSLPDNQLSQDTWHDATRLNATPNNLPRSIEAYFRLKRGARRTHLGAAAIFIVDLCLIRSGTTLVNSGEWNGFRALNRQTLRCADLFERGAFGNVPQSLRSEPMLTRIDLG
ncbi:hypothetical protein B0H13DRAFT_2314196 [Mycena leptocephala]|nr:hypothetical protein B0H13DRAFT_2314196 [Mycena leptocephala]